MNTVEQDRINTEDSGVDQTNPRSGASLVPMLVAGIVLTFGGMIAALVFTSI